MNGLVCLQLNGFVLFVVFEVIGAEFVLCVCVCRTCNWIKKTCGFAELTALGDRSLTFLYICVAGCFRYDSQWCPLTSAEINFAIQPFGWIIFPWMVMLGWNFFKLKIVFLFLQCIFYSVSSEIFKIQKVFSDLGFLGSVLFWRFFFK